MVPEKALEDYHLRKHNKVILMPGSHSSGGFALTSVSLLRNSIISRIFEELSELAKLSVT